MDNSDGVFHSQASASWWVTVTQLHDELVAFWAGDSMAPTSGEPRHGFLHLSDTFTGISVNANYQIYCISDHALA